MVNAPERLEDAKELLEGGDPREALKLLKASVPRAWAMERAHLTGEALRALGALGPCLTHYHMVLGKAYRSDPELWLESALGAASSLRSLGRTREARALLTKARRLLPPERRESVLLEEALLDRAEGRCKTSIKKLGCFLRRFTREKDWAGAGFIFWAIAGAKRFSGDLTGATMDFLRSSDAFSKAGDPSGRGYALLGLGGVERIRGNFAKAFRWYSRAEKVFQGSQDRFAQAYALCGLGNVLRQKGNLDSAEAHYKRSYKVYAALGDRVDLAYVDWGMGRVALLRGRLPEAKKRLEASLVAFKKYNEVRGIVLAQISLASALHALGNPRQAEAIFAKAYKRALKEGIHAHLEIFT